MKKFLFILFCVLPMYAMEDEKIKKTLTASELKIIFKNAVEFANENPSAETFKKIENCLNQGVSINAKLDNLGKTAIILAVEFFKKDLFEFLLQKGADINSCDDLERTPLEIAIISQNRAQLANFDIEKDFLMRGAIIKTKKNRDSLLYNAMQFNTIEAIKPLIKYGVDVNERYTFQWTPLRCVIQNKKFEAIKELCNLGASLINIDSSNSNAFHAAIEEKLPKNYINLLIINSRFNTYNKEVDEQLEKKIITAYLALERNNIFPKDIQIIILSHLALDYLYGFNKKFCKWLVKNGKDPFLAHAVRRANYLEHILQNKDDQNKTALQVLHDEYEGEAYIQKVESLVNGTKLQQDRLDFMNGSVQEDNLVVQIYEHNKKLLES